MFFKRNEVDTMLSGFVADRLWNIRAAVKQISVEDLERMIGNDEEVVILDIRDPYEYEAEHISGAIHMSRGVLDLHVNEIIPDKNATIVVYWIFDKRSPLATKTLNDLGYKNAVNLKGGFYEWKEEDLPINNVGKGWSLNY